MSIIQEALRRKAEDPGAPPPPFPGPPPTEPESRPPRRPSVALVLLLILLAIGVAGAAVVGVLYVGFGSLRMQFETVPDSTATEFQPYEPDPATETPDAPPAPEPAPAPAPAEPEGRITEPAPPPPAPAKPVAWPHVTLVGVLAPGAGQGGAALFQGGTAVSEGETFHGIRVAHIGSDSATLTYEGEEIRLRPGQSTTDPR